jgi:hypothetical protein
LLINTEEPAVRERLEAARDRLPEAASLLEAIQSREEPFRFRLESPGFEFQAEQPVEGRPNRATMKLFRVEEGPQKGRGVVLFYKQSQVPYSRDRLAYGVCMLDSTGPEPGEVPEWIFFASSGFHPDARPKRLRQAFTFSVPD